LRRIRLCFVFLLLEEQRTRLCASHHRQEISRFFKVDITKKTSVVTIRRSHRANNNDQEEQQQLFLEEVEEESDDDRSASSLFIDIIISMAVETVEKALKKKMDLGGGRYWRGARNWQFVVFDDGVVVARDDDLVGRRSCERDFERRRRWRRGLDDWRQKDGDGGGAQSL